MKDREGGLGGMEKRALLIVLSLFIVLFAGCAVQSTPVLNNTDLSRFDFSQAASLKEGSACATYVLGLGPFGSASVMDAIKEGKIKTVKVVDYKHTWLLLVSKDCVTVYGDE
jgi:hypothetical protein